MTDRPTITKGMKLTSLFLRGMVVCVECGEVIATEHDCEWDHRIALGNGGEHSPENIGPIHRRMGESGCHRFQDGARSEGQAPL